MPIDAHGRPVSTSTTATDDHATDACPYCRGTSGVHSTPAPPTVQAWTCTACGTNWAITSTPRPAYLVDLGAVV
jgi:transposase-like protein